MLFASSQATLVFHYCGGELHSVILADREVDDCCERDNIPVQKTENTLQEMPCCSNHIEQIDIDDFQVSKQYNVRNDLSFFAIIVPTLCEYYTYEYSVIQQIFPLGTDELIKSRADLLTSICIFKI
jgi:hypothetical protein